MNENVILTMKMAFFLGAVDFKYPVQLGDIHTFQRICRNQNLGCTEVMHERCSTLLRESGRTEPNTFESAVGLFQWFLQRL